MSITTLPFSLILKTIHIVHTKCAIEGLDSGVGYLKIKPDTSSSNCSTINKEFNNSNIKYEVTGWKSEGTTIKFNLTLTSEKDNKVKYQTNAVFSRLSE